MALFIKHTRHPRHQSGNALIGFIPFFASMLAIFLFIFDIGQYSFYRLSVDNAAYAASQSLSANLSLTDEQLARIAMTTSPALAGGELTVTYNVSDVQDDVYIHHLPAASNNGEFIERASNAAFQTASVSVQFSYQATTPFSRLLAQNENQIVMVSSYEQIVSALISDEGESSW